MLLGAKSSFTCRHRSHLPQPSLLSTTSRILPFLSGHHTLQGHYSTLFFQRIVGTSQRYDKGNLKKDSRFLIPLYLTVIIDCLLYGYILYGVSIGRLGANNLDFVIYLFGAATLGAVDVSVGHELIHRTGFSKVFWRIPWFKMLNTHLYIYHVQLHHKHTEYPLKDPSIPYQYKSVYSYSNLGREPLVSTYNYEVERLAFKNITSPV